MMQKAVCFVSYYALAAWMAVGMAMFVDRTDKRERTTAEYLQIGYAWPLFAGAATLILMHENI